MSGTRQELRLPPARWAAKVRADRRGAVVGFVGSDDRTHAIARVEDGGTLRIFKCDGSSRRRGSEVAFIANPKFKLCLACVSALEDEIQGGVN